LQRTTKCNFNKIILLEVLKVNLYDDFNMVEKIPGISIPWHVET